jgi:Rhodopirellula transposase DDE domain
MFSPISANWAGEPLGSYETVLKYLRTTRTETGFHCRARLDRRNYPPERRVTQAEKAWVRLKRHPVQPQWNYTIYPHRHSQNG